jgi:hypothetical protein
MLHSGGQRMSAASGTAATGASASAATTARATAGTAGPSATAEGLPRGLQDDSSSSRHSELPPSGARWYAAAVDSGSRAQPAELQQSDGGAAAAAAGQMRRRPRFSSSSADDGERLPPTTFSPRSAAGEIDAASHPVSHTVIGGQGVVLVGAKPPVPSVPKILIHAFLAFGSGTWKVEGSILTSSPAALSCVPHPTHAHRSTP